MTSRVDQGSSHAREVISHKYPKDNVDVSMRRDLLMHFFVICF